MLDQIAMNIRDVNIKLTMEDVKNTLINFLHSHKKEQREDFANLIEGMFGDNEPACSMFIKITLGSRTPNIVPENTLVKVGIGTLFITRNYKYKDVDNKVSGTIVKFHGWHHYAPYTFEYVWIDANGDEVTSQERINHTQFEVIEEF